MKPALMDGIVTGLAATVVVVAACALLGHGLMQCTEWVFIGGGLVAVLSSVWAIAGYSSPPGLLSVWRGDVEVYPSSGRAGLWVDRFLHPRNVWLIAGAVMVLTSFLLLLI